jgi:cytochrome c peroxidase
VFQDGVTSGNVARALASYLRTLRSGGAPVDRYRHGDSTALSAAAQRGLTLFLGPANCAACHVGPNFTDEQFHNTGVAWRSGISPTDSGRAAITRAARDVGAFKTPTLREAACTAPYMHDGSLRTLEDVIDFYDRGGHANPHLDEEIRPLRLDAEEKGSLLALLRALGGGCRPGRSVGSRAPR